MVDPTRDKSHGCPRSDRKRYMRGRGSPVGHEGGSWAYMIALVILSTAGFDRTTIKPANWSFEGATGTDLDKVTG